jgi:hypothetical protein
VKTIRILQVVCAILAAVVVILFYRIFTTPIFDEEQLIASCKTDFALDREAYSVRSRNLQTWEILLELQKKYPPDSAWLTSTERDGRYYYVIHVPWRGEGTYQTIIWQCLTAEEAHRHIEFLEHFFDQTNQEVHVYTD